MLGETGVAAVLEDLPNGVVSAVNFSELAAKVISRGGEPAAVWATLLKLPIEGLPFDTERAYLAASLYPATRCHGVSLADRACLALGGVPEAAGADG